MARKRTLLGVMGGWWCAVALATTPVPDWFTVHGEPRRADTDTVQVDPVARDSEPRIMGLRVNRATPRTSWDGVPYRSYVAEVEFDCTQRTARYLSISFYADPLWQGTPVRTVDYSSGTVRHMEFREIQPNPTQRIISAACPARR